MKKRQQFWNALIDTVFGYIMFKLLNDIFELKHAYLIVLFIVAIYAEFFNIEIHFRYPRVPKEKSKDK